MRSYPAKDVQLVNTVTSGELLQFSALSFRHRYRTCIVFCTMIILYCSKLNGRRASRLNVDRAQFCPAELTLKIPQFCGWNEIFSTIALHVDLRPEQKQAKIPSRIRYPEVRKRGRVGLRVIYFNKGVG